MILVNFASRSRPSKFHDCLQNIAECFTNYFVLAKIDRNDPTIREYLSTAYPEVIFDIGHSKSKVEAINTGIPQAYPWDILVNTSDDIKWRVGAGDEIRKQMEPDTFLHFPEPYADSQAGKKRSDTISVVSIMDRVYYDRFGYVYNPKYFSLCCDNEATEVARMIKRYKFVNKVIFEHLHPAAGKGQKDELLRYTESFFQQDKATLLERRKNKYP